MIDIDIHVFPARPDQLGHRHYDIRFVFVAADADLLSNDEVLEARWASLGEIGGQNPNRSVVRPTRKVLGDLSCDG